jgi:undecaprenyl-diphosphatase
MLDNSGIGLFNQPILSWMVDHRTPDITSAMKLVSAITSPAALIAITLCGTLIWAIKTKELRRPILLIGAIGTAAITSTALKIITHNERPSQINMVTPFETDFSFPSGHTILVVTLLFVAGYLIYSRSISNKFTAVWVAISVIGTSLVAVSRLYLGYHWLTDTVASIGLGLTILALIIFADKTIPD